MRFVLALLLLSLPLTALAQQTDQPDGTIAVEDSAKIIPRASATCQGLPIAKSAPVTRSIVTST